MKTPSTRFGQQLRECRISKGLTQVQLAELSKIQRADITRYELTRIPTPFMQAKLSLALGVDVSQWLEKPKLPAYVNSDRLPVSQLNTAA